MGKRLGCGWEPGISQESHKSAFSGHMVPCRSGEKFDRKEHSPKPGKLRGCRDGSLYPFFRGNSNLTKVCL